MKPWHGRGRAWVARLAAIEAAVAPSERPIAVRETIDGPTKVYDFEADGLVAVGGMITASKACNLTIVGATSATIALRPKIGIEWHGLAVRRLELGTVADGTEITLTGAAKLKEE